MATEQLSETLARCTSGIPGAFEDLVGLVDVELRSLARRRLGGEGTPSLRPSDLANEAYLRLIKSGADAFDSRRSFFAAAAVAMRSVVVDHARRRQAAKRGSGERPQVLEAHLVAQDRPPKEILDLDCVLDELKVEDERAWQVVQMRYWVGLGEVEIAEILGISDRTVRRDWNFAKAWIAERIASDV